MDCERGPEKGFFRAGRRGGMWTILDPQGRPFHLRGCNHYSDGSHMPWSLADRYGTVEQWRASVRDRHREWGFTYMPPSIGPVAIDPETVDGPKDRANLVTRKPEWPASHYAALEFPFTLFLEIPKQYMAGPGMGDVFGEEFRDAVGRRCRKVCLPLKDNRHLIGYHFCHNPPWNPTAASAEQWIDECTRPGSSGLKEWVRLMRRIYGSVERWRETYGVPIETWDEIEQLKNPLRGYVSASRLQQDKEAFLQRICERWHRVYVESIRRYDPNHLILGDRNTLHLQPPPRPWALQIMRRHVDVLSVNIMGPPRTIYGVLEHATRHWDGPILLADTGACVYAGEPAKSGYHAADIDEFEQVYAGMMEMSVEHPQIVGFGWCGYYETPHPGGRGGLVDCRTDEPLPERLRIVRKWNDWSDRHYAASRSGAAAM